MDANKVQRTPELGYSLKPYEVRKDVPGFEGFIVSNPVTTRSSNTFRESENKASAFVRVKAEWSTFSMICRKNASSSFLSDMVDGAHPKEAEVKYDQRGFIELRLEDYPIIDNDRAITALTKMALRISDMTVASQLRTEPVEKKEPEAVLA